jgi:PadR family transcriptional regulator PadR
MMDDLTAFQRDVLYVIGGLDDDSPPYGLAIKEELDRHYSGEINHGRLYPNLNELAEMGLVEKGSVDDRTNSYGLTERGSREIEARREWEDQYVAVEA